MQVTATSLVAVTVCVCVCVCVSERQGSSLQLQLEQTTQSHASITSSSSRERNAQTRQSRGKSHRRVSPYQSRDTHLSSRDHYTPSQYDHRRYYYDQCESYIHDSYSGTCMTDYEFHASSLPPYNYTLYDYDYVSAQRSPSPRHNSACAVHSSVIVRRHSDTDTQTRWPTNSCRVATECTVSGYDGEERVGDEYAMVNSSVAGYTSVIVATPAGAH